MSAGSQPHGRMPAISRIAPHAEHERAEGLGEARTDLRLLVGWVRAKARSGSSARERPKTDSALGAERGADRQGQPDEGRHDGQVEHDRRNEDERGAPGAEALAA